MPIPTRALAAIVLTGGLAACAELGIEPPPPGSLDWEQAEIAAARAYAAAQSETPFENGPMSVIATEGGTLRSYLLVPCRGGAAICAGGLHGAAGRLEVTADYHIVRGLYGNRTFWLSPGGDGAIGYPGGQFVPLAWDSVDQPVSEFEEVRFAEMAARSGE